MNYLIIGASAAGINAAKTLRKLDRLGNITIISKDDKIYSRSMLQYYLSGVKTADEIRFIPDSFFAQNDIQWIPGKEVVEINTEEDYVSFFDIAREKRKEPGSKLSLSRKKYDKLLIATGASSSIPENLDNLKGVENVYHLRNIEDADEIKQGMRRSRSATVIGGGLIGVYIAIHLARKGIRVSIIEFGNNILALQLDPISARPYQILLEKAGIKIYTNSIPSSADVDEETNRFTKLYLSDGQELETDILVLATGISPNIDLLKGSNIMADMGVVEVRDTILREGILVNKEGRTNVDNIYAAGDVCAEKLGIWDLAVREGIHAAYGMVGIDHELESNFGLKNSMSFFGINTVSLGDPNLSGEGYIEEVFKRHRVYKKIIHKDGIIKTAILQGDISNAGVYETLIKDKIDISNINKNIFDLRYADFYNINQLGEFFYEKEDTKDEEDIG